MEIVGPMCLKVSAVEDDMTKVSDLTILRADGLTIACRVRAHEYADKYPYDFTVRSHRDSGAKTEMEKIMAGWGDWMFYGFAAEDGSRQVEPWRVLNLEIFRQQARHQDCKPRALNNGDGTHFLAFDVRRFDPGLVIDDSERRIEAAFLSLERCQREVRP